MKLTYESRLALYEVSSFYNKPLAESPRYDNPNAISILIHTGWLVKLMLGFSPEDYKYWIHWTLTSKFDFVRVIEICFEMYLF